MPNAKVISVDAIKQFRASLVKFAESVNAALGNAESDVNRALTWLDMEAKTYWQGETRKGQAKLAQAMEALRMKTLYKGSDGTSQSAVDEKKEVAKWKARLELCQQKQAAVQRYTNLIQRETVMFKGAVQRFATTIQSGVPRGIARLDRVMNAIDAYVHAQPEAGNLASGVSIDPAAPGYIDFMTSMTRAEADEPGKQESEEKSETPAEETKPEQP